MPSPAKLLASASGASVDPNFRNVTLLLHGDGSNGAQNNTFVDSSTNNFTITRNGNPTQGSFSPYGSRWSNYFDGTGDYLSVPTNAAFSFGTGDFTIECWLYMTSYGSANQNIIDFRGSTGTGTNIALYLENVGGTGTKQLRAYDGSGDAAATANNFALNTWTHVAITRSSNSFRFFVNGTQVGSTTTVSTNYSNTAGVFIGAYAGNSANFFGYLSDFRVVKGTAVYTAAFTPPIAPLTAISGTSLLTCQSNRILDASTNNFAITVNGNVSVFPFSPYAPTAPYSTATNGGSMYFDGTGDYLTSATATAFGTSDFTVEGWFYAPSIGSTRIMYDGRPSGTNGTYQTIYVDLNGYLSLYANSFDLIKSTNVVPLNAWNHFALCRSGTSTRLFLNGVQQGSTYTDTNNWLMGSSRPLIGGDGVNQAGNFFVGYLSDIRAVNGTALYTSTFTPPTAPLTAISGTSFLLNGTNAGIVDSSADNDLETVGNAQISTSVKKFGTGSIYFDGTGDWLTIPQGQNLSSGNWTIEFWVYFNSFTGTTSPHVFNFGTDVSNRYGVYRNTTGKLSFFTANSGSYDIKDGTTTVAINTWYHVAVVSNGGTRTMYVNGTSEATSTSAINAGTNWALGFMQFGSASTDYLNGYIDDLRITKGVARYTANFTPPTAAFPDQ